MPKIALNDKEDVRDQTNEESNKDLTGAEEKVGVKVPESFQQALHGVLDGATREELEYAMNCVSKCLADSSKKEYPKTENSVFDSEGMDS